MCILISQIFFFFILTPQSSLHKTCRKQRVPMLIRILQVFPSFFGQCWIFIAACRVSLVVVAHEGFSLVALLTSCGYGEWAGLVPCAVWGLSPPSRDQTHVSCVAKRVLNHWTTREVPQVFFFYHLFSVQETFLVILSKIRLLTTKFSWPSLT